MDKATAAADVLDTDTIGSIATAVAWCVVIVPGACLVGATAGFNRSRKAAHWGRRKLTRCLRFRAP